MKAKEFYDSVTEYLEGYAKDTKMHIGKYMVHPYSYNYGFSKVEELNGLIVMWKGDLFENNYDEDSYSDESSLPLTDILEQIKKCIEKYGDLELVYEKGFDYNTSKYIFETPTQFIVSYGNITPINL